MPTNHSLFCVTTVSCQNILCNTAFPGGILNFAVVLREEALAAGNGTREGYRVGNKKERADTDQQNREWGIEEKRRLHEWKWRDGKETNGPQTY